MTKRNSDAEESHGILWLLFFMPGAAILWLEYMFPKTISGSFGSARRRKSRLVQFWYTMVFYAFVAVLFYMNSKGVLMPMYRLYVLPPARDIWLLLTR